MAFAIKTRILNPKANSFEFAAQKTMYGGKGIASGDALYLFSSENSGGRGLFARGIVTRAVLLAKRPGLARQTATISITVKQVSLAKRPLGRQELKKYADWGDARPETELNFKFYRQATDKVVGLSEEAAQFLARFF